MDHLVGVEDEDTGLLNWRRDETKFVWIERAMMVALPIVANIVLAVILFAQIGPVDGPSPNASPLEVAPQAAETGLGLDSLLRDVNTHAEKMYHCDGPWSDATGRSSTWACRTDAALAVLTGTEDGELSAVDVTWFGFDLRSSDLALWARACTIDGVVEANDAASWTLANAGRDRASKTFGRTTLAVDGARGAYSLSIGWQ